MGFVLGTHGLQPYRPSRAQWHAEHRAPAAQDELRQRHRCAFVFNHGTQNCHADHLHARAVGPVLLQRRTGLRMGCVPGGAVQTFPVHFHLAWLTFMLVTADH